MSPDMSNLRSNDYDTPYISSSAPSAAVAPVAMNMRVSEQGDVDYNNQVHNIHRL